jgi:membrane-associated phospholipid phosphatase
MDSRKPGDAVNATWSYRFGRWIAPYAALWITLIVGGVIVVALALLGAEVYADVVDDSGLAALDEPLLAQSKELRTPELNSAVTAFTNIGGSVGMPILTSILTAWLTFVSRTWRPVILVMGAAAVSVTATTVGKDLFGRTRPSHIDAVPPFESSPSFPSGHALNTTVVIGVLVYLLCLQVRALLVRVSAIVIGTLFVIAMGLSRVFLGHHWMTDVIFAWLLGLAWLCMVILAHRLFHLVRRREHAGPAPTFDHPAGELPADAGGVGDTNSGGVQGPAGDRLKGNRNAGPEGNRNAGPGGSHAIDQ